MTVRRCISADSHVVEPADIFMGLEERFGEQAPRIIRDPERGDILVMGDQRPVSVGRVGIAGNRLDNPSTHELIKRGYDGLRQGIIDPSERLKDQDIDGVQCEVLFPSLCLGIWTNPNLRIVGAVMERYNDWLWDYCGSAPDRLMGLALIPLQDSDMGIRELDRVVKKGYRGACIPNTPPADRPYSDRAYDPFWAAAQEAGIPLCLHLATTATPGMGLPESWGRIHGYALALAAGALTIGTLICSGVCHRFPDLRFVPTEWETGWVAHYLERLDHAVYRERALAAPELDMAPSEYFRRQFYMTFEDDEIGLLTADYIGVDNLMWGSDYPHHDSIWPHSQEVLDRIFEKIPEDRREDYRQRMTVENVSRLYQIGVPA